MDANEKLVSVYTASTPGQADIARLALEEAGIRAALTNDLLQGVHGFATVGAHALPNVLVAESDVAAAKEVLAALTPDSGFLTWNRKSMRGTAGGENAGEVRAIDAWPLCPRCQKPRMTVCPICSTSGNNFPRADENFDQEESVQVVQIENADAAAPLPEQRLAVICTTCDEPWLARFLRRCEWCGHDFGAGLKLDRVPQVREPTEPINPRAVLLTVIMAVVLCGVFAWFWLVGK
jgi:hypothetical protein